MAKLVSKTYGEALFDMAVESDKLKIVSDEVKFLRETFQREAEFVRLLNHPKLTREEKKALIERIFKGRVSDEMVGFLLLIVEKGRQNELDSIFRYFEDKEREHNNIGVAFITSAVELSKEQKKKVEKRLLATTKYVKLEMNYNVDQALIGGIVIRIGDRVVDSSIRTRLERMSGELQKIKLG